MLIQVTDKKGQTGVKGSAPSSSKSMLLKVSDAKSTQIVKEIEARFPDTRDYDDAIYLAKYYYDKHRYRKAENWAMQANTIDSTQEESWIIYAKAKAKQGHRAAALRILQAYYDQTGSLRAKMLIDRIRKGRKF
jgi:tetratricopeptide (TPR) repeat protein